MIFFYTKDIVENISVLECKLKYLKKKLLAHEKYEILVQSSFHLLGRTVVIERLGSQATNEYSGRNWYSVREFFSLHYDFFDNKFTAN